MSRSKNAGQSPGVLEVVCGPMFSGKSEELMRRIRRAKIAKQNVLNLKHQLDNRHAIEYIVSHDGNRVEAAPFENAEQLIAITQKENIDVIGIDEAQFFSKDIVPAICQLVNNGKRIIVAGLDLDFKGSPFGCMPLLLAIADKVLKLQSICTQCGHDAHYTQRLVNGRPAKHDDPIVLIGAQESYQARCRSCYSIDKMPTF